MNALYLWLSERSQEVGPLAGSLARITIVLAISWLAHAALARANPRWRVLTWRMAAIAVLFVPAMDFWAPAFQVHILPAKSIDLTSDLSTSSPEIVRTPQPNPQVRETPFEIAAEGPPVSASLPRVAAPAQISLPRQTTLVHFRAGTQRTGKIARRSDRLRS